MLLKQKDQTLTISVDMHTGVKSFNSGSSNTLLLRRCTSPVPSSCANQTIPFPDVLRDVWMNPSADAKEAWARRRAAITSSRDLCSLSDQRPPSWPETCWSLRWERLMSLLQVGGWLSPFCASIWLIPKLYLLALQWTLQHLLQGVNQALDQTSDQKPGQKPGQAAMVLESWRSSHPTSPQWCLRQPSWCPWCCWFWLSVTLAGGGQRRTAKFSSKKTLRAKPSKNAHPSSFSYQPPNVLKYIQNFSHGSTSLERLWSKIICFITTFMVEFKATQKN